ncbi:MAG: alanine/ornithine racemase family PLP-dependent enzyme [Bacillota bacterium]
MQTPHITIDVKKIEHNARTITTLCKKHGISVAGVTKGTLGMPEVARAMIRGGVTWIGESRLDNIAGLRESNINVPFLLMRSPHKSEIERVITLADISLNTEYEIIEAISQASLEKGMVHKIIIMVDLGDLREGIWPDELLPLVKEVMKMKGVRIVGLGTNLTDLNGTIPTYENNQQLVELAEEVEEKCNIKLQYLSAGNSSSLKLLASGKIPDRINHFRIGEGILLGRETIHREIWPDTYQDAFVLSAEIIEKKYKPSVPIGEIGQDAFGNIPTVEDKGMMVRGILNIGRQDMNVDGVTPQNTDLEILGATSDHLIIDATRTSNLRIGDIVSFDLNYASLLAAMTSPFVKKIIV